MPALRLLSFQSAPSEFPPPTSEEGQGGGQTRCADLPSRLSELHNCSPPLPLALSGRGSKVRVRIQRAIFLRATQDSAPGLAGDWEWSRRRGHRARPWENFQLERCPRSPDHRGGLRTGGACSFTFLHSKFGTSVPRPCRIRAARNIGNFLPPAMRGLPLLSPARISHQLRRVALPCAFQRTII